MILVLGALGYALGLWLISRVLTRLRRLGTIGYA
jgi:hypothetical protein